MAVSESRKKANQKWDAANLDRVSIAMPKGMKDTVKAAATVAGESMNQYIISATEQRINGSQQPTGAQQGDGTDASAAPGGRGRCRAYLQLFKNGRCDL